MTRYADQSCQQTVTALAMQLSVAGNMRLTDLTS
jgi:hypothetical protein